MASRRLFALAAGAVILAVGPVGCGIVGPPPIPPPLPTASQVPGQALGSNGAQVGAGGAGAVAGSGAGGGIVPLPGAQPQAQLQSLLQIPPEIPWHGCIPQTIIGTVTGNRVVARVAPNGSARAIASFGRRNVEGSEQTFDVFREVTDRAGHRWLQALLPIRPNGTTGYLLESHLRLSWTNYWLEVDRHNLRLTLWQGCKRLRVYPVGVGTSGTPTPVGRFYLASLLKPPDPNTVYGPYAFGLSGYSEVIHNWTWGGVIGLHGTDDPSSVGHFVSHGCIRMYNRDIEQLVGLLPLGTPIVIH